MSTWRESAAHQFLQVNDANPFVDEQHVRACDVPGWRLRNFDPKTETYFQDRTAQAIGAVQTAAWFELDAETFLGVMNGPPVPALPELPPLPFRRCLFQLFDENTQDIPVFSMDILDTITWPPDKDPDPKEASFIQYLQNLTHEERIMDTPFFVIFEQEQGVAWDVMQCQRVPLMLEGGPIYERTHWPVYQIRSGGVLYDYDPNAENLPDERAQHDDMMMGAVTRSLAINAAELISARNVQTAPALIHRKQRRALQRLRFRPRHQQQYRVIIDYEDTEVEPGKGDRRYTCRWLVRGHWRHLKGGEKTWVRAHVKGPAGAPWKGRPIHTVDASPETEPQEDLTTTQKYATLFP